MTRAHLAAIRAEMQLHSQRMADLNQIRALALRVGNGSAVSLVDTLIARETRRHQSLIASLMPTNSRMAHR